LTVGAGISVEVRYLNYIAEVAGIKDVKIDLPEGANLRDLLRQLGQQQGPQLSSVLMDEESGNPNRFLLILVNQTHTREAEIPLKDGDVVVFSGIVAGG
jgi:molybdopterin converting factor small subunit